MTARTIVALAGVSGSLLLTAAASAGYTGLAVEYFVDVNWVGWGYTDLVTYRVYAQFDSPTDELNAVYGSASNPLSMSSWDGLFWNDSFFDSLTAPMNLTKGPIDYWPNQWDTYVTIGATDASGDQTQLTPGFAAEVGNLAGDFTTNNAAWFATPGTPQGFAGVDGRVLLAQLTVASGGPNTIDNPDVSGIINLEIPDVAPVLDQFFSSAVPAPGALAVLALAGLAGVRRRRR